MGNPCLAHVLEKDSTIGAVMHMDPADDPLVGQPAYFFFEFKDTEGKFSLDNCDCTLTIEENEQPLSSQALTNTNSFIFPHKGAYDIHVNGQPKPGTDFTPFALEYHIQVHREAAPAAAAAAPSWFSLHFFHLVAIIIVSLYTSAMIIREGRKEKQKQQEERL
jgi:hypothetical protein